MTPCPTVRCTPDLPGGNRSETSRTQPHAGFSPDIRAERTMDPVTFAAVYRRAVLDGCKWDPQVGDVSTLSPFPLVMRRSVWQELANHAERLSEEAVRAEAEIAARPDLLRDLGFPRSLARILADTTPPTPAAGRVIRFDFHLTAEGWRISEANSDVPGGFTEASHFTSLMAEHFPLLRPAGDPANAWADALAAAAGPGGVIALLSAEGFMEDHQVIAFLAARLRDRGCQAFLANPRQISWRDGAARLDSAWYGGRIDALVRFYQSEWLARLNGKCDWRRFFRGGATPVANPGTAAISESKRFPLVWARLCSLLPTWQRLLPETRDPRDAPWETDDAWLIKSAMCNTGDTVCVRELLGVDEWSRARRSARWSPRGWVAQRRFESLPIATPTGPRHVCIGVYTINGRAAGVYARLAVKPVIDFAATDAALLLDDDG